MLIEDLKCHLGKTVTIFTTSGGLSGAGFTGVIACVTQCTVKLITDIGAPPACPVGSACTGPMGGFGEGFERGFGGFTGNMFGAITEIPIDAIACFVHHAI